MARRPSRKPRKAVFVACEGESERGYVSFLHQIANAQSTLDLHFDIKLCRGGNHLAILEQAEKTAIKREQKHSRKFWKKAVFLDADLRAENLLKTQKADRIIERSEFIPVWSNPCLEALLLNHFPRCENLKPPTSNLAEQELKRHWKDYNKPITASECLSKFDIPDLERATRNNSGLLRFLKEIGLIK